MRNKKFVWLIKKGIKKEKISLRELARRSSLDVSFLSKILSGKRNPPSKEEDIRKIAKALNISAERLIISCRRIPSNMKKIFEDEDFVKFLLEGDLKNIRNLKDQTNEAQIFPGSEKEKSASGEIED